MITPHSDATVYWAPNVNLPISFIVTNTNKICFEKNWAQIRRISEICSIRILPPVRIKSVCQAQTSIKNASSQFLILYHHRFIIPLLIVVYQTLTILINNNERILEHDSHKMLTKHTNRLEMRLDKADVTESMLIVSHTDRIFQEWEIRMRSDDREEENHTTARHLAVRTFTRRCNRQLAIGECIICKSMIITTLRSYSRNHVLGSRPSLWQ